MTKTIREQRNAIQPTKLSATHAPSNTDGVLNNTSDYDNLTHSQSEMLSIQKNQGNRAVLRMMNVGVRERSNFNQVRRFEGPEHRLLGEKGSGNAVTDINIGTDAAPQMLTYGEMVGVAGDWFKSVADMRTLAGSQDGRDQIRWALWKDMNPNGGTGEPVISQPLKDAVMENYFKLAADNVSHFSAGGTAQNTYKDNHKAACRKAYDAGVQGSSAMFTEAQTIEAFGNHFLTDMFSAGHIRTPRQNIKTWYTGKFPKAIDSFITYMAAHMHDFLVSNHGVLEAIGKIPKQAAMEAKVRTMGGAAIQAFSLGDIVSLAAHNFDNSHGLNVISDANDTGAAGPKAWNAMGDNNLSRSADTQSMAVAAIKASLQDLDKMRKGGMDDKASAGGGALIDQFDARMTTLAPASIPGSPNVSFTAERFIPREDTSKGNTQLLWEWGKMNPDMVKAVDDAIKKDVADALADKASALPTTNKEEQLTKEALTDLVAHFKSDGINAIQRALGNVSAAGTPAATGSP